MFRADGKSGEEVACKMLRRSQVDDLDLKPEAKEALLWKTAETVFGI